MGLKSAWRRFRGYKNGIIFNMLLNMFATGISLLTLQFAILPYISRVVSEDAYGLLISVLSVLNIVPFTLGNSLNGIRLLRRFHYEDKGLVGDYNIILVVCLGLSSVVVLGFCIYYYVWLDVFTFPALHVILTVIVAALWMIREYYTVSFLMELRYDAILKNNLLLCLGYGIGLLLFHFTEIWEFIYIAGFALSLIYTMRKTPIWKEPFRKTKLFKETAKEQGIYFSANVLYRIPTYADKVLLYPLLGGAFVSVYYVATLAGRVITMLIAPLTHVMLSYLAKSKKESINFTSTMIAGTVICVIGYFVCYWLSRPILSLLYPQFVDRAMLYVGVTTATVMVTVLISILNPFFLRRKNIKWQFVINIFSLLTYVGFALALFLLYGAMGFCVGCLIATVLKLLLMLFIYFGGFGNRKDRVYETED